MKNHSMIFDDFFKDPYRARTLIGLEDMVDVKYKDGVTYPNISNLPLSVHDEIRTNLKAIVGPGLREQLSFARYSFANTKPPHWAHSDGDISQFLALIYLNDSPECERRGTVLLEHKELKFDSHPETDLHKDVLLSQANDKNRWVTTFTCPGKFNRCLILNANLIHAAVGTYGADKTDGRLVISVFFNLAVA